MLLTTMMTKTVTSHHVFKNIKTKLHNGLIKTKSNAKKQKLLVCTAIAFLSMMVLFDDLTLRNHERRKLKCMQKRKAILNQFKLPPSSPLPLEGVSGDVQEQDRSLFDRFLAEFDEECDQPYPADVIDIISFTADSPVAQEEPMFDIAQEPDEVDISAIATDDGDFVLAPEQPGDNTLDETERDLVTSFYPEIYDADEAFAKASTSDEGTIAYVVATTACPVDSSYQPPNEGTIGDPESGPDLYEASAVIKAQVCAMTEQAAATSDTSATRALSSNTSATRRLGKPRKLVDQISPADMFYTM